MAGGRVRLDRQGARSERLSADSLAAANDAIEEFLDWTGQVEVPEVSKLARTVTRWKTKILA